MTIKSIRTSYWATSCWVLPLCFAASVLPERVAVAQDANATSVEVTVTGEGISEDDARNDALRKALEQGGKVFIDSYSEVENYTLVRDTIYARAEGIVKDYKILEKGDSAIGAKFCKIRAVISKDSIASTWGEVQNVLDQVGRPGILVFILERIDGVIQDSSILESKIEKRLLDAGFAVYSGAQVRAIAENESADAHMENNIAKVQAIAKNFGTQIFIHGTAQANWAGVKDLYGTQTAMFNGDGMVKMFYTDTGQLLASESLANWRGGARGINTHSPQAGKMALGNAGVELVDRVYASVMKRWATRISAGGEITLEVEGIKAGTAIKLKKKLAALPKVKRVNQRFSKGIATYRIVAKMTAEQLAEYLVEPEWESLIEIVDITLNRVQAKGVGK
ncbi:MAG: hypothetical protein IID36_02165 [Planctomycetes bacterium]|nr:hypothetical protein [Planctomycetota bacterium]